MNKINTKKLILLGLMVSYSLVLFLIETIIPNPLIAIFPGAKLGLSNIITLLCLINFGLKDTFKILTVRIIISSMFAGPISTLLFSIAGGYMSLFGMYLALKIRDLSIIGVSVCGAIMHNIGQLLMAAIIIKNISMMSYLPVMLGASVVTGVFIGIVAKYTEPVLKRQFRKIS
ncbi:Gx transporter family protein [Peptostreptococcus canis]|uniref:Gx transporter family protein n=1 Tax=Peptostreptococcus canis TaxID=1159213 RepID=A0ABR6TJ22_9FIRM|nr:Gx transporter family protein [Peptostreptococcus canis]MBC2575405.1 Gx transporter family protein [Peptostreptococcus canis]MBP1997407.1 heptaprenyl diphosphate synthase [Peptostreptococcus canis]